MEDKTDVLWKPQSKEYFEKEPKIKKKKKPPEWKPMVCGICTNEDTWYDTKDVRKIKFYFPHNTTA